MGFINIFSKRATVFYRWAKLFELNFFRRQTFLKMIKSVGETVLTKLLKLPGVHGPQWNTWYQYNIKQTSAENKEKYQNEILGEKDLNIFAAIWNCSSAWGCCHEMTFSAQKWSTKKSVISQVQNWTLYFSYICILRRSNFQIMELKGVNIPN